MEYDGSCRVFFTGTSPEKVPSRGTTDRKRKNSLLRHTFPYSVGIRRLSAAAPRKDVTMKLKKLLTLALAAMFFVISAVPTNALSGGHYTKNITHYPFVALCAGSAHIYDFSHTGTLEWDFNQNYNHNYEDDLNYKGSINRKIYNNLGAVSSNVTVVGDWGQHLVTFSVPLPNYSIIYIEHTHKINEIHLTKCTIS